MEPPPAVMHSISVQVVDNWFVGLGRPHFDVENEAWQVVCAVGTAALFFFLSYV